MRNELTLDDIALGDIAVGEARTIVFEALKTLDNRGAQRVYAAFRDWLWKTMTNRRRDDELNEWYELMRRAAARLSKEHFALSERITALYEVLYQTVRASEVVPSDSVVRRKHVQRIIDVLAIAPHCTLERSRLLAATDLEQSNLSRLITMMEAAGLVERSVSGKEVSLILTRHGQKYAKTATDFDMEPVSAGPFVSTEMILSALQDAVMRQMQHGKPGHWTFSMPQSGSHKITGRVVPRTSGDFDYLGIHKEDYPGTGLLYWAGNALRVHE